MIRALGRWGLTTALWLAGATALGAPPDATLADARSANAKPANGRAEARAQAKAQVKKGQLDYKLARFEQALEDYSKAYELYPAPALLFNLGQCHRNLKNYERAIFFFEGYLREQPKIDPDQRGAHRRSDRRVESGARSRRTPPPRPPPPDSRRRRWRRCLRRSLSWSTRGWRCDRHPRRRQPTTRPAGDRSEPPSDARHAGDASLVVLDGDRGDGAGGRRGGVLRDRRPAAGRTVGQRRHAGSALRGHANRALDIPAAGAGAGDRSRVPGRGRLPAPCDAGRVRRHRRQRDGSLRALAEPDVAAALGHGRRPGGVPDRVAPQSATAAHDRARDGGAAAARQPGGNDRAPARRWAGGPDGDGHRAAGIRRATRPAGRTSR